LELFGGTSQAIHDIQFPCSLWLLEVAQHILKSCLEMVQPDSKGLVEFLLSQILGFFAFEAKGLRMLISRDLQKVLK
jgi:hypothetical protein